MIELKNVKKQYDDNVVFENLNIIRKMYKKRKLFKVSSFFLF